MSSIRLGFNVLIVSRGYVIKRLLSNRRRFGRHLRGWGYESHSGITNNTILRDDECKHSVRETEQSYCGATVFLKAWLLWITHVMKCEGLLMLLRREREVQVLRKL